MRRPADIVAELLKSLSDDLPSPAIIVALEIPNVLEDQVLRVMLFQDGGDLMKQRATCLVLEASLAPRFGERLAREACAEDIVRWYSVLPSANIAVDDLFRCRKIPAVEKLQFRVDLRDEDAVVPEVLESEVEASEPCEKVDEFQCRRPRLGLVHERAVTGRRAG